MNRFDITQTNAAVERLIETTENPRHLYLLHAYNRHRYLEMAGRFEEIFTPDIPSRSPSTTSTRSGSTPRSTGPRRSRRCIASGPARVNASSTPTATKSLPSATTWSFPLATLYQQTPGSILAAEGVPVDPDTTYLLKAVEHMIWPYDDQGRLIGEDVWEYDESVREFIPLDPIDVLTVEQSAKLLDPLIKPLPAHNPFTA